jgi:hypothetical protein
MGESSPDKIILSRVREIKYVGESSPEKYLGENLPDTGESLPK